MGNLAQATVGSGVKLYINNRVFGIVTSFEWMLDGGRKAIRGIDQTTPFELAPTNSTLRGTINCVKVRGDGGLEGRAISAIESNVLLEKYISILLVDRLSGDVIFRCDKAAVNSQNWRVGAKELLRGSFTFEGLEWSSEFRV